MLGSSSLTALLVYVIRRHKMDDYRGRYRLWLWCAAALLIALAGCTSAHSHSAAVPVAPAIDHRADSAAVHSLWTRYFESKQRDLATHVSKERDQLYPQAVEREAALARR